jgi:hypothetical protein
VRFPTNTTAVTTEVLKKCLWTIQKPYDDAGMQAGSKLNNQN